MKNRAATYTPQHNKAPYRRTLGVIAAVSGFLLTASACETSSDTSQADQAREIQIFRNWESGKEKPTAYNGQVILRKDTRVRKQPFMRSDNATGSVANYKLLKSSITIPNPVQHIASGGMEWYGFFMPTDKPRNTSNNPSIEEVAESAYWVNATELRDQKNKMGVAFMAEIAAADSTLRPWFNIEFDAGTGRFVVPGSSIAVAQAYPTPAANQLL